jgi:hypothetical protein
MAMAGARSAATATAKATALLGRFPILLIKGEVMANASHPHHLFTHEWLEQHPRLAASLGKETVALVLGTLLAVATLAATSFEWLQEIPLGTSPVIDIASRADHDAAVSAAISNDFFDHFVEQKKAAKAEELPAQF